MKQDNLNNLTYGTIFKNLREQQGLSQERLAQECHTCRETIGNIERGKTPPSRTFREIFARVLSNPVLEHFPPYSIGQFPERIKVRFQHEKEAVRYFLEDLQQQDLDSLKGVYSLYQLASERKNTILMMILDEYLHTIIINAHPNYSAKALVQRYRLDYMDFFKVWVSQIDENLDIILGQITIHLEIFEGIFQRNQHRLIECLDLHLDNSLEDFERIIKLLKQT